MSSSVDVDHALARCRTLLDALLTVNSLGLRSGLVSVSSRNVHGWVAFEGKHIVKAMVVETAQIGRGALPILAAVPGATYSYKPLEAESSPTTQAEANSLQVTHDQTTMVFGEQVVAFRNSQEQAYGDGLQSHFAHRMTEEEFRKGVFDGYIDPREQFLKKDNWLSAADPPLKDFVQHQQEELAAANNAINLFAKAGFAIDFRDPTVILNQRDAAPGAPGVLEDEKEEPADKRRPSGKLKGFVMLAVLVFVGYVVWTVNQKPASPPAAQKAVDDNGQAPFQLPAGQTAASPPAAAPPVKIAAPPVPEPADAKEFALANNRATLSQLEQLIEDYMQKGKFKHARDLAGAGLRSPFATFEEKRRFYALYQQCLNMISVPRNISPTRTIIPRVEDLTRPGISPVSSSHLGGSYAK